MCACVLRTLDLLGLKFPVSRTRTKPTLLFCSKDYFVLQKVNWYRTRFKTSQETTIKISLNRERSLILGIHVTSFFLISTAIIKPQFNNPWKEGVLLVTFSFDKVLREINSMYENCCQKAMYEINSCSAPSKSNSHLNFYLTLLNIKLFPARHRQGIVYNQFDHYSTISSCVGILTDHY